MPTEAQILADAKPDSGLIYIGNSLILWIFEKIFADPVNMPNRLEMMHYPFILVGYLTLFYTALNLLPIGQLDGGHVMFGWFGQERAGLITRGFVLILIFIGGLKFLKQEDLWSAILLVTIYVGGLIYLLRKILYHPTWRQTVLWGLGILTLQGLTLLVVPESIIKNYTGTMWFLYAFLAVKFIGLDHPMTGEFIPLDWKRKALAIFSIVIFFLCFSPNPIDVIIKDNPKGTFTMK